MGNNQSTNKPEYQGLDKAYNFLLIGKTGCGKSETGNMLLGKSAFKTSTNTDSTTSKSSWSKGWFENILIKVADTPGVKDTRMNKEKGTKHLVNEAVRVFNPENGGFHMLLILFKYGEKCTEEMVEVIYTLEHVYGPDYIRKHGVIIVSHGDNFDRNEEQSFAHWCGNQKGKFEELMKLCRGRVLLFDNLAKGEKRRMQVLRLLHMASSDVKEKCLYTKKKFQDAEPLRNKLIVESQKVRISLEIDTELQRHLDKYEEMTSKEKDKTVARTDLFEKIQAMEDYLVRVDNNTNVLKELINHIRLQRESFLKDGPSEADNIRNIRNESRRWKRYAAIGLIGLFVVGAGTAAAVTIYLVGPAAICAAAGAALKSVCTAATVAAKAAYTAAVTAGGAGAIALSAAGKSATTAVAATAGFTTAASITACCTVGEFVADNPELTTASLTALIAAFNNIDVTNDLTKKNDQKF